MQTDIVVQDADNKHGRATNSNPNHGGIHKEKPMNAIAKLLAVLVILRLALAAFEATLSEAAEPAAPATAQTRAKDDYLAVVKTYADTMIEKGRDTYGTVHSPLFAATLDRKTHKTFDATPPDIAGIRGQDRPWKSANPMHDLNLYQILYALTDLTGEDGYAAESDKTLRWFLGNCQSKETGLPAWGEHCHRGFVEDRALLPTHEFYRPWVLWDRCYGLDEQACLRFARGLWDHQIRDKATGNFSRHATYDKPRIALCSSGHAWLSSSASCSCPTARSRCGLPSQYSAISTACRSGV